MRLAAPWKGAAQHRSATTLEAPLPKKYGLLLNIPRTRPKWTDGKESSRSTLSTNLLFWCRAAFPFIDFPLTKP